MKVLFGFNKDDLARSIALFYEQKYGEHLEQKTVFYFKNIMDEVRKNDYDRLVILEELERFPVNNYAQIDEYLFRSMDRITDDYEAKNIIFVASDRRRIGDEFLTKLFNLGIYNVLTGQDRVKSKVTDLIHTPKTKRDVKQFYEKNIQENIYQSSEVSELEIQKILVYYRDLMGDTSRYVETYNRIAEQYTNEQMRIIIKFLPEDVIKVLETSSERYNNLLKLGDINFGVTGPHGEPVQQPQVVQQVVQQPVQQVAPQPQVKVQPQVVQVQSKPEIVERIVVQKVEVPQKPQVVKEVVKEEVVKEVVKSVYQVPKDYQKVVCLVGPSKAGTTFCINALTTYYTRKNIKTAIVDMTRKRDTYSLFTYDNEGKRAIAAESLKYAANGLNEPLVYGPLSIYTSIPGEERKSYTHSKIIDVVKQNNSVVLVDCDFTTPYDYFRMAQEIYVVQDMDVPNIGQTTVFLRELKNRGVPMNKIKIIINKHVDCKLTSKAIIDGMATYTTPDLKAYDELFYADQMEYFNLSFDQENYKKYIEMMYKYTNTFSSFTEKFLRELDALANTIFPTGKSKHGEKNLYSAPTKQNVFGSLRKMKNYNKNDESDFEKTIN